MMQALRSQGEWICDIWVAPGVSISLIQEKISEGYDIEFELDEDRINVFSIDELDNHPLVKKVYGNVKPGSAHTGRPCKEVVKEMLSGSASSAPESKIREFMDPKRVQVWINRYCNSR